MLFLAVSVLLSLLLAPADVRPRSAAFLHPMPTAAMPHNPPYDSDPLLLRSAESLYTAAFLPIWLLAVVPTPPPAVAELCLLLAQLSRQVVFSFDSVPLRVLALEPSVYSDLPTDSHSSILSMPRLPISLGGLSCVLMMP